MEIPLVTEVLKNRFKKRYEFCFLNLFIYFNWRLITLQYCHGFAIHCHESAMGAHVSPS